MRRAAFVLVLSLVATAILAIVGWPASEYRHNDFASFWVGSRMLLQGSDPYDADAFAAMHREIGSRGLAILPQAAYGYPLTTALLLTPFALLPFEVAAPLWLVTQLVAAGAGLVFLARVLFAATLRRDLAVLLALAVSMQPAWLLAAGGNIGGFLLAVASASSAFLLSHRPVVAGGVAGLLIVKPHPLLIAGALVPLAMPRRVALRAAVGAAMVALPVILVSFLLSPGWLSGAVASASRMASAAMPRATLFGLLAPAPPMVAWIVAAAIVAVFALWIVRSAPPLPLVIGAAVPLSLFCFPYGWSYDQTVLLVSAGVIIANVAAAPERTRAMVLVALALVFVPLSWSLYALAFVRGQESAGALVPIATLALVALSSRWSRPP